MNANARHGLAKIIAFLLFIWLVRWANATQYIGKDDGFNSYYICNNNREVAELLGYDPDDFDLTDYHMTARKTDPRTDNLNIYLVMINIDDTFTVCYRTEEYDIFFYSWDDE